jgi:Tol biopolymer transport system component
MQDRESLLGSIRLRRVAVLLAAASALAAAAGSATAAPGSTEIVSVRSNGKQGDNISARFSAPVVSANGLVVAFDSIATNLVGGDNNGVADIFVHDRVSGRTERVSVSSKGKQSDGLSRSPSLSADGRFIAFESLAASLVPGDTNNVQDLFLHDRLTGETKLVSVGFDGTPANGTSLGASISGDGRFVAFASDASNLTPSGAIPFGRDVYVRDILTGTTEMVSVDASGQGTGGNAPPDISADGRFVAFGSFSPNLVPGDTNDAFDVFVRDRATGTTVRASVDSAGVEGNAASTRPRISADGRFVAFGSEATNLVPGDTNGRRDVFVRDLLSGTTERVSVDSAGNEANGQSDGPGIRGGLAFGPDISGDGRFVAFDSIATNLVPDDTNTCGPFYQSPAGACPDIFVRDRVAGTTVRVSVDSAGAQANAASTDPAISADGSVVAFFSPATNLVPNDTNTCPVFGTPPGACPDVFAHVG